MADVYLAIRSDHVGARVNKLVVIKRLRDNLVEDQEFIAMLMDEARLAAKLNHPAIVQTNEFGKIGNQYYLSMEFLDGQPLHRILHRMRAAEKPWRPFLNAVLLEVLSALSYAHTLADFDGTPLRIIHRDVTPQNIFVTYDGSVKLVDFGIAKASGRTVETRQGIIKGKIAYMSPEQAIGRSDIDARSDLFAVGVLLYEAAVGDRMWKGKDEREILKALLGGHIPFPSETDPSTPEGLDAVCRKATARSPADRYKDAAEMQMALEHALRSTGHLLGHRELGQQVADLFKDKRAQLREMIDRRITALASRTGASEVPSASLSMNMSVAQVKAARMSASSTSSSSSLPNGSSSSLSLVSGHAPISQTGATLQAEAAPIARRSRSAFFVVGGGALLLLAGAAVFFVWRASGGVADVVGPSTESSSLAATGASTVAADPPRAEIQIVLKGMPADVRFRIDDGPLLENPYVGRVPRSSDLHQIRATADGYRERLRVLRFESNLTLELVLEKSDP